VHGLGGDPFATWRAHPRDSEPWPNWVAEDQPDIDVWTVEYEASPSSWSGSAMALPDRAANLSAWFETERLYYQPLVFITHSLGGLLVKQLLRLAADRPGTVLGRILPATQGVVFLGTPNTGSDLASWMDRLRLVLGTSAATKDLQSDSPYLRDLNGWYRERAPAEDIATLAFAETRATKGIVVVEQSSADPGIPGVLPIPVDADHISIAKPSNRNELVYRRVQQFVGERLPASRPSTPIGAGSRPRRFFISYRRRAEIDARLAHQLSQELARVGHEVFIDVEMTIGTEWARRIADRIDWCEFLVVLLSAASIESDMVQEEVRLAHQRRKQDGTPFILPVRVCYEGPLGYALGAYIERLQYALWTGDHDTVSVFGQIFKAAGVEFVELTDPRSAPVMGSTSASPVVDGVMSRPTAAADPRLLKHPAGALTIDDPAYVERTADRRILAEAAREGATLIIEAPRQSGKTSLLIRYLNRCEERGKQIALVDFQIFTKAHLDDFPTCLSRLARAILRGLSLDPSLHRSVSAPDELTDFMEDVIFPTVGKPIALGFDEVDRFISCPWRNDFYAMLRYWHNLRSMRPARGWRRLDLALVVATEPSLLITDRDQSPFNVGERLRLDPFDEHDLAQLNHIYGDLLDRSSLEKLAQLVGGQPYLSRISFFHLAVDTNLIFADFLSGAATDGGPFGEHLRARFSELVRYPELANAYRMLLSGNAQPTPAVGHQLEALGLARADVMNRFAPANLIYAQYFGGAL
jgi:hypothetical protein